jgi:2-isopropylmalate synthase
MKTKEKIHIFDTTLRDGQQSPGAGMSFEDNLHYADLANALNIDILEAGFPAASQNDFDIVHTISEKMKDCGSNMTIAALCQLREQQITRTIEALKPSLASGNARLHTYLPVDPNLMQASLGSDKIDHQKLVDNVYNYVKMGVDNGFEVEFSPEGYSRMRENFDFTTDAIRAAVSAGATIINCPDTIGGASRWEADYFVWNMNKHAKIMQHEFPDANLIWSAHCHNDLGLALDNSLLAVTDGPARQIEGCLNGVGERAGNAALEQCIMVIDQFGENMHPEFSFFTDINLKSLNDISDFIAENMLARQPHWPITGENAARHSSGGHTNAVLKNPMAYQPFDPKQVGKDISFVFGPLSGGNHAKDIIEKHGFHCSHDEKVAISQAVKDQYADRRKGITDEEVVQGYIDHFSPIKIREIDYSKDESGKAVLKISGQFFTEKSVVIEGEGANSALTALDREVKKHFPAVEITDYRSNACAGSDVNAKCNSTVIITLDNKDCYVGKCIESDINASAIGAYVDAVNQAYINTHHRKKGEGSA